VYYAIQPAIWARESNPELQGARRSGKYRPVIDRTYPLEQVVDATTYVETEQKLGNVVLIVATS
jgi:NADPH:quinone reductase-like Zn-dependent oxidoreductase